MCIPFPRLSLMTLGAIAKLFVRPMRAVLPPNTNTPLRPFAVNRLFVMTASAPSIIMPSALLPVTSHESTVPLAPWKNRMPMPAAMPAPAAEATRQFPSWAWLPVTTMALRPPVTCRPFNANRSAVTVSVSVSDFVPWMPEPGGPAWRVTPLLATVTCSKHVPTTSMVSGPRRSASTSLMVLPLPQRTLTFSFPAQRAALGDKWQHPIRSAVRWFGVEHHHRLRRQPDHRQLHGVLAMRDSRIALVIAPGTSLSPERVR